MSNRLTIPERRKPKQSITYFVEALGLNMVKIGATTDLRIRLASLQGGSPVELRLMGTTLVAEDAVHAEFSCNRVRGTWFVPTPRLLSFIAEHARLNGQRIKDKRLAPPEKPAETQARRGFSAEMFRRRYDDGTQENDEIDDFT